MGRDTGSGLRSAGTAGRRSYCLDVLKQTTIEIDQDLPDRAGADLGQSTTRGAVESALRLVARTIPRISKR